MTLFYAKHVIDALNTKREALVARRDALKTETGPAQFVVKVGDLYLRREVEDGDEVVTERLTGIENASVFNRVTADGWAQKCGNLAGDTGESVAMIVALGMEYARLSELMDDLQSLMRDE